MWETDKDMKCKVKQNTQGDAFKIKQEKAQLKLRTMTLSRSSTHLHHVGFALSC